MDIKSIGDPKLVELLLAGKVGVIPSDTVYGVVCIAASEVAVARLYALKNRVKKPGPIIAASIDQIESLGIKRRYLKAVEQYWPNPISIEIPHSVAYLNQGTGRQAFRVVSDKNVKKLLEQTGPLLTSSANAADEPTANNIEEAKKYFGDKVDFYVDGGDMSNHQPSTVIRVIDDAIEVVRGGAVKMNEETGKIL